MNNFTILLYHGVTDIKSNGIENYSCKHLNYKIFKKQMNLLKKKNRILSIDEMVDNIKRKKDFKKNSVVITFDDGFKNNYSLAAPILDDLKIPAVFYITSKKIGKKDLFWVDKLEAMITKTKKRNIVLELNNRKKFSLENNTSKVKTLNFIKKYLKRISFNVKDHFLSDLEKSLNVKVSIKNSKNYETMSWKQVNLLNNNSLFTIGAHNLYHNSFAAIPNELIDYEIFNSIKEIQDNINQKVIHYSYPEGTLLDFNAYVIKTLKKNKIICCPTAIYGKNSYKSDLFLLKRIAPNLNGAKFPFRID